MDEIERDETPQGTSRRTVMMAAAWAAPVVALAAAAPMAAASNEPQANFAFVGTTTAPTAGSNLQFRANGQVRVGNDYEDGAVLPAGELFTFTFTNGATADGFSNLVGLTHVSGNPATGGPVVFAVTEATSSTVSVRFTNVQPSGGVINGTILNGGATATIQGLG